MTLDKVPKTQLWELATYDLKPRLNRLNGVATVIVQGGQQPEFQIEPDPTKLLSAGVTVTDMLDAVKRTNLIDSPGLFERNHQLVLGLISGQVQTPEQIAGVAVKKTPPGNPPRPRAVGHGVPEVQPLYTIFSARGQPAGVLQHNHPPHNHTPQGGAH